VTSLPIRWKVTSAFAAALLVVLTAVGAFVYLRFADALGDTLDRGLRARAAEVSAAVQDSPAGFDRSDAPALEPDENVAQVVRDDGTVVAGTSRADFLLLDESQLDRARRGAVFVDRPGDARLDESIRLLALPVQARGERFVVVVGTSLDEKREALAALLLLEVIGLVGALVVSSTVGYLVAGLALRPVEAMRRRAEEITDHPDVRLPVPAVDDEVGRLGATLNEMLDRIARAREMETAAVARERRFVADASHELRTPLTILKSEVEVALLGHRSVPELEAALRSTLEETDRLARLAEDLLVLAQFDEGRLPIHAETLVVADLIEAVAGRQRRRAGAEGRGIVTDAPPGLTVVADRLRLEQALTNLVDNALTHGAGDVGIRAAAAADGICIAVNDHGAGFPPGFGEHAFERFTRAGAGRSRKGTGLGLSIVSAVAQAHGGRVEIVSGPEGSVQLSLPTR